MKISVGLNSKSIQSAIKELEKAKQQLQDKMINEFYKNCYEFFVDKANYYVQAHDIGYVIKEDIKSSWQFETIPNGVRFVNNAEKAVFVEFGVGIAGENSHPNAQETGYEYNVPSDYKRDDNSWEFVSSEEYLDIPLKDTITNGIGDRFYMTYGTQGALYAFNALEDLRIEMPKIWQQIKIKYWG